LALWQSRWVAERLAALGVETTLEIIKTTGDKITDVPLAKVGTKGLFTKELEEALLERRIDLAVHSLKDMPTVLPDGLTLAATPEREDPRDVFISRKAKSLTTLPQGAVLGTASLRRQAIADGMRPLRNCADVHHRTFSGEYVGRRGCGNCVWRAGCPHDGERAQSEQRDQGAKTPQRPGGGGFRTERAD
jgi:hydroxymethylbilane synthase